jgi:hypothetical protein
MSSDKTGIDFTLLAEGVDELREVLRALVMGFMADGFTEEQARVIVAGFFVLAGKREGES